MSNRNFIKPAQDVKAIRRYYNVKTVKQRLSPSLIKNEQKTKSLPNINCNQRVLFSMSV